MVGRDRMDQRAGVQVGGLPAFVVPVAVEYPAALVEGSGVGTNAVAEDLWRRRVAQLHRGQPLAAVEEVHVGVVEAGNDAASTQFKHFGRGSGPASDFDVVADRRDLSVEAGAPPAHGLPGIAGPIGSRSGRGKGGYY